MSSNLRTVATLFKLELDDMFNTWEASKPLRTGAPHASAILAPESDWCVRRHVLSALYPEEAERLEQKPWSAHTNAVFLNGWCLHEKYQKLFSDFGTVIEVETSHFDETRFVHFTPDLITEYAKLPYVWEIKGYKAETWEKLDESGDPPEAAWHQCNLYCHILQIPRGIVLVENKNTQQYKIWCIQHDPALARPYTDRCYAVKGAVTVARATGKLPERMCATCTDARAQKCHMRRICFKGRV
jgi:hypothetical protein